MCAYKCVCVCVCVCACIHLHVFKCAHTIFHIYILYMYALACDFSVELTHNKTRVMHEHLLHMLRSDVMNDFYYKL